VIVAAGEVARVPFVGPVNDRDWSIVNENLHKLNIHLLVSASLLEFGRVSFGGKLRQPFPHRPLFWLLG
jgi:hypothetical protein